MSRDRQRSRCSLLLVTGLVVGAAPGAWADERPGGADRARGSTVPPRPARFGLAQCRPGELLPVGQPLPISATTITTLRLPGAVTIADAYAADANIVDAGYIADTVMLRSAERAQPGATATIRVQGVGFDPITLPVRVEPPSVRIHAQWVLLSTGEMAAAVATARDDGAGQPPSSAAFAFARGFVRPIDLMDDYDRRTPIENPDPSQRGALVRATRWIWSREHKPRLLRYYIENLTGHAYRIARAYLQDDSGRPEPDIEIWLGNHLIMGDAPPIVIEPGVRVEGFIWVLDPERLGSFATLAISEPNGTPRVHDRIPTKVEFIEFNPPLTREQKEQRRREREARRVALHVTGSYGALFLSSGVTGVDGTEAASLTGLGVRVTKGIVSMLAFEAEIGGATSGVATFDDVTIDGMTGDLRRSARLARASFGAMVRFGERVVPHVRAGIGLQVVDQEAALMTVNGPVDAPGAGLEVGGSVYGGAGVDVKLGSNLIAGVGLAFTAVQKNQQILDLGINLAYRWDATE